MRGVHIPSFGTIDFQLFTKQKEYIWEREYVHPGKTPSIPVATSPIPVRAKCLFAVAEYSIPPAVSAGDVNYS